MTHNNALTEHRRLTNRIVAAIDEAGGNIPTAHGPFCFCAVVIEKGGISSASDLIRKVQTICKKSDVKYRDIVKHGHASEEVKRWLGSGIVKCVYAIGAQPAWYRNYIEDQFARYSSQNALNNVIVQTFVETAKQAGELDHDITVRVLIAQLLADLSWVGENELAVVDFAFDRRDDLPVLEQMIDAARQGNVSVNMPQLQKRMSRTLGIICQRDTTLNPVKRIADFVAGDLMAFVFQSDLPQKALAGKLPSGKRRGLEQLQIQLQDGEDGLLMTVGPFAKPVWTWNPTRQSLLPGYRSKLFRLGVTFGMPNGVLANVVFPNDREFCIETATTRGLPAELRPSLTRAMYRLRPWRPQPAYMGDPSTPGKYSICIPRVRGIEDRLGRGATSRDVD